MNLARMENVVLHQILGYGGKTKKLSQRDIYRWYLELTTQRQDATGYALIELDLVLDMLWERMDGRAKHHHCG